jgi:hypothetical protein
LSGWLAELHRRDRLLSLAGWLHVALAAVFVVAGAVDGRTVLGIDPWVKPLKFALSITVYVWTLAWLLEYVRSQAPRATRAISVGVSLAMATETLCIASQSLRGVPSHFNVTSALDGAIFTLMGNMIALNTALVAWLLWLFLQHATGLPRPQLWGIRLGLVFLLLGSVEGGLMIGHGAHTVGARDGGAGLPLLNWSTQAGDLRPAHALALHGLQAMALAGWLVARSKRPASVAGQTALVFSFSALYLLAFALLLSQAWAGRPLIAT